MTMRLIAGLVLLALGAALCVGLLSAMYGAGPWDMVDAGIPGVLLIELVAIAALCVGGAVLAHVHFRRRRRTR